MKLHSAFLTLIALLVFTVPVFGQGAPFVRAQALVGTTNADIVKGGIKGIAPHVADLEKALADGAVEFPLKTGVPGQVVALTDGMMDTIIVLAAAAKNKQAAAALANPYPPIGLFLALHYNDQRKPEETLRVIAATLERQSVPGANVGAHSSGLFSEQAFAFNLLKRWDELLAAADAGLKSAQNDRDKARSHRNRGFALVELKRLDEAEAAYRESIKLEPGNPRAQGELDFIAKLKGTSAAPPAPPIP